MQPLSGLVADADGSVTITISQEAPDDAAGAANWLPARPGPFRPIQRVYMPGPRVLDMTYPFPPIERMD